MVEDSNQKFYEVLKLYPLLDINQNLEEFKKYVRYFCEDLNKELLAAYIFFDYAKGYGDCNLFGWAAIADGALEALETLDLQESVSFIEMLYEHYVDGGRCGFIDAWEVFIQLYIGKVTVRDVINTEEEKDRDTLKGLINKYYTYLEEGVDFNSLHYAMMYDYDLFCTKKTKHTNVVSGADGLRKEKALYCANHIYTKKHNLKPH